MRARALGAGGSAGRVALSECVKKGPQGDVSPCCPKDYGGGRFKRYGSMWNDIGHTCLSLAQLRSELADVKGVDPAHAVIQNETWQLTSVVV